MPMITFLKQNKLLALAAIVVVLGGVYYFLSSGSSSPALLTATDTGASSPQSQSLLVVLANLKTIRLDDSVFSDPVFTSLSDFDVVIAPENVGRRNPFVPFTTTATSSSASKLPIPGHK